MNLSETDILEIIKQPRNAHIKNWRADQAVLDIYVNGGDVASELEKIKNYENDQQKKLREKIARSTRDKVKDLLNPLNKIFNASGGSIAFDGLSQLQQDNFQEHIDKLPEGFSFKKWMEIYWKRAFVSDPNGVVLIETDKEGISYPAYKNISVIHDYVMTWDKFEYIVFEHRDYEVENDGKKEKVKVYRVFDEVKDALYYEKGGKLFKYGNAKEDKELIFDEDHSYDHNLGFVPAVVCGGIVDIKTKGKVSFIEDIREALREYLRASSVHTIYKFLHLFPKFWSYAMKCVTCNGTGQITNPEYANDNSKPPKKQCPTCAGKRLATTTDVSNGIYLPIPKEGQPNLGDKVAGYIDTPINAWEQQNEDLKDMLAEMSYTLWGAYLVERDNDKERTATESVINVQPINENLHSISRIAESKASQLLTYMARIESQSEKAEVKERYGKRFIIETPDVLWEKYLDAKERQAPVTTLDYHYDQYLMAEYQNDLAMLEQRKKIFSLEPYAHYSVEDMQGKATPEQIQSKLLFSLWLNEDIDFTKDRENLKKEFEKFYQANKQSTVPPSTDTEE